MAMELKTMAAATFEHTGDDIIEIYFYEILLLKAVFRTIFYIYSNNISTCV